MNASQLCDVLHHINRVKGMHKKLNGASYELALEFIEEHKLDSTLSLDAFLQRKLNYGVKKQ